MGRKPKAKAVSPEPETDDKQQNEELSQPPTEIDPYEVLSLDRTATSEQIKAAYKKAALKHHPDKVVTSDKDEANKRFQEIAFAYAILSDDKRRKRYDTTGNTAETLDDDDFNWADYFQSQTKFTREAYDQFKNEYQGSDEERKDVLRVYEEHEGDMDALYEEIMCSNVLDDDDRFRKIVDGAITAGDVDAYGKYTKENKAKRKKRIQKAKVEAGEAMELAEELGVKDQIFGSKQANGKNAKGGNTDALSALIQQRQKDRAEGFFDRLEAKYGGGNASKSTNKSKRKKDEPPEEMFAKNAKRAKSKT